MEISAALTSIVSVAVPVILVWTALQLLFPPIHPDKKKKIPPYCSATTMEVINAFGRSNAPKFIHGQAKEIGFPKVFSIRLPAAWRVMMVEDQKIARDILTDPTTTKPPSLYSSNDRGSSGMTIFSVTTNGKFWKDRRKESAHAFASAHITRMRENCAKQTERWIEQTLKPSVEAGRAIDLSGEMGKLTLQTIFSAAFEYELSDEETEEYLHEIGLTFAEFVLRQAMNPLRKFAFWLSDLRRANQAAKHLQNIALKVMQAHRDNPLASKETLIGRIVNNPCYKDDKDCAADITAFLAAGHELVGHTVAWTILYLAKNPEEMKKLRAELRKCSSRHDWSSCRQLQNVILESFRFMPAAPLGVARTAGRDFEYKDIFIPKGTILFITQILLGRNPTIFENPDEFIPDRWNDASPEQMKAVMPYSAGERQCIGQSLAKVELNDIIPSLIMDYEWEIVEEGKPAFFVTMKPAGAKFRVVPASPRQ